MTNQTIISVVDLFCGAGGAGVGWNAQPGFRVTAAVDKCTATVAAYRKNVLPSALVADATTEQHKITECARYTCDTVGVLFMHPPTSVPLSLCLDYVTLVRPRVFFVVTAAKSFSGQWGHKTSSAPPGYDVVSFRVRQSPAMVDLPLGVLMGVSTRGVSDHAARQTIQRVESVTRQQMDNGRCFDKDLAAHKGLPGWFRVEGSATFKHTLVRSALSPRVCGLLAAVTRSALLPPLYHSTSVRDTGILVCATLSFHWATDGISPDPEGEISVEPAVVPAAEKSDPVACPQEEEAASVVSTESPNSSCYSSTECSVTGRKRPRERKLDTLLYGCSQNMRDHFNLSTNLSTGKHRRVSYTVGTHKACDRRVSALLGCDVPRAWKVDIKESARGEVVALRAVDGRAFRSMKKAREALLLRPCTDSRHATTPSGTGTWPSTPLP
jgi:hypothetical protein